jgi:hypothetical protein
MAANPPRWLKPGDQVAITIEGIGTLRNPVVAEGQLEPEEGRLRDASPHPEAPLQP